MHVSLPAFLSPSIHTPYSYDATILLNVPRLITRAHAPHGQLYPLCNSRYIGVCALLMAAVRGVVRGAALGVPKDFFPRHRRVGRSAFTRGERDAGGLRS